MLSLGLPGIGSQDRLRVWPVMKARRSDPLSTSRRRRVPAPFSIATTPPPPRRHAQATTSSLSTPPPPPGHLSFFSSLSIFFFFIIFWRGLFSSCSSERKKSEKETPLLVLDSSCVLHPTPGEKVGPITNGPDRFVKPINMLRPDADGIHMGRMGCGRGPIS